MPRRSGSRQESAVLNPGRPRPRLGNGTKVPRYVMLLMSLGSEFNTGRTDGRTDVWLCFVLHLHLPLPSEQEPHVLFALTSDLDSCFFSFLKTDTTVYHHRNDRVILESLSGWPAFSLECEPSLGKCSNVLGSILTLLLTNVAISTSFVFSDPGQVHCWETGGISTHK